VSRVASQADFVRSHNQDLSSRRPAAAETRQQSTLFDKLLPDNAPPPSPHERPQSGSATTSKSDTQPDKSTRRQGNGGPDNANTANQTDTANAQQPTTDGKTDQTAVAETKTTDAKTADAKTAEANAAAGLGGDGKAKKADDAAIAVATDASIVQQPVASVPVPVVAAPGTGLPAAAPAPDAKADGAKADGVAAADGAKVAPAGALGTADEIAGQTKAGETKGQAGGKGANASAGTAPSSTPDASKTADANMTAGKTADAKPATTGAGDGDPAASAAAASDGPAGHDVKAGSSPTEKGEPAHAHANHSDTEIAAPKPAEGASRPQVEAQAAANTDKAPVDGSQVTAQQHPTEPLLAPATAQTGAVATSDQVAVPVAGLAVEIAARAQAGSNRFEIRLDPPELGRIDVRLDVDRDGQVTSRLTVDKVETLDLLRRDAPELQRALQDAGLKTSDNGMQFTLRDQSFGGQNQNSADNSRSGAARLVVPDPEMAPVDTVQAGYARSLRLGSGIDIRV
jgi:flagellar hook-length control protein FliK